MAKRVAIILGLVVAALLAGLAGVELLGGPFISRGPDDAPPAVQRYALGRDIYRSEDYNVDTRYAPYEPGGKRIARPTIGGARALEPYQAARPDHRIVFDTNWQPVLEEGGTIDYDMIDPPVRPKPRPRPSPAAAPANAPQNLLPGEFRRTETPVRAVTDPAPDTPPVAPSPSLAPAPARSDAVTDTERRINDITRASARRHAAPADSTDQPGI